TTAVTKPGTLITAYSYDAANRPIDTVLGSSSTTASAAGLVDASGGSNVRSRVAYDADGHVVATFEPRAFATSTTDPTYMTRTDFDVDGRPVTQYVPRYNGSAASDLGLSTTQTAQCPTTPRVAPQSITGIPAY